MSTVGVKQGEEITLKNLLTAFNGESNAHAKYTAFAKKAEEEGFLQIAGLFRAAARAEQIHAGNHAKLIQQLGGTAVPQIEKIEVGTTAENLKVALAGEEYEIEVMYPDFIKQAEGAKNAAALRTFHGALAAEKEHARLYRAAIERLNQSAGRATAELAAKANYYVCPVCGYTTEKLDFDRCPVCKVPQEKFEVIN